MIIQPLNAAIQWSYTDLSGDIDSIVEFRCITKPEMNVPRKVIT